ncbi:hypothetical protein BST10_10165 [Mycolicibacter algericus DSM 45454]|uniref:Uncharacterized protein n=1 Tax=Mycolicibacter algericus DSM 45454 TaxID=723879 RepID=A0ABX3RS95_MYCAL|nr:hypothetical protein BST10_10165 [Mycolicibacter algericus DSM 45454]
MLPAIPANSAAAAMPKTERRRRSPQHLITTELADSCCRHCRAPIWEGYCGGEKTRIDPTPITRDAELGATLADIPTYQIPASYTRRPTRRTQWNIHRWPPGNATIHADHQCGRVWPAACIDPRPNLHTPTAADPLNADGTLFEPPPPF